MSVGDFGYKNIEEVCEDKVSMDLSKLSYQDILNEDFQEEYLLQHKKFYYELVEINMLLVMFEKIREHYLGIVEQELYSEALLIRNVHRMLMLHLPLRVCRISLDDSKGMKKYTIREFKNSVVRNIVDGNVKTLVNQASKKLIIKNDFTVRLTEARNDFLAHKLTPYVNSNDFDKDFFEMSELKTYILELNEYFKLLTFDVALNFDSEDFYTLDLRKQAVECTGGDIDNVFSKLLTIK